MNSAPNSPQRPETDNMILVVGGYGAVGRVVSTALGDRFPGQVIAAGRSHEQARRFASSTGNRVLSAALDVSHPEETASMLGTIGLVVMCVETDDTRFAQQCIERGIDYIDISATSSHLTQIAALNSRAKSYGSTTVLSVGLAPGMTNLLASHSAAALDEVDELDVFVMLGLGEAHGAAALTWMIERLTSEYTIHNDGRHRLVKAFGERKRTVFPGSIGRRTAYRFDFSDQHTLATTLNLAAASTWVCFESAAVTNLVHLLQRTHLLSLLRFDAIKTTSVKLLQRVRFGSDLFVTKVVATGKLRGEASTHTSWASGHGEAETTGVIAAEVAAHLYTTPTPRGVFHIDQIIRRPEMFIEAINKQVPAFEYCLEDPLPKPHPPRRRTRNAPT